MQMIGWYLTFSCRENATEGGSSDEKEDTNGGSDEETQDEEDGYESVLLPVL